MKKFNSIVAIAGIMTVVVISSQAQVLYEVNFLDKTESFKIFSDSAKALGGDYTIVINPAGATAPKDTVIDQCTLVVDDNSSKDTEIRISKPTQNCVPVGDTAGCSPGRLSLRNSKNGIKTPAVQGPCTITYYCAGSSNSTGRSMTCLINGVDIIDAGFSELTIPDPVNDTNRLQATRKKVYFHDKDEMTSFFIYGGGGGTYLYDIKIESGQSIINSSSIKRTNPLQVNGLIVNNKNNARIEFYNLSGAKVMTSNASAINVRALSKGVYFARISGTHNGLKFIR